MKRLCALTIVLLLLCASAAFADNTLTKEYEFTSETQAFSYNAPESVIEDGVTYLRKDIRYELIEAVPLMGEETMSFEETRTKTGLAKKNDSAFPEMIPIEKDGYKGEIPRVSVEYAEQTENGDSKTHTASLEYGAQVEKPTPPDSQEKVIGGKKLTLALKELKQSNGRWEPNFTAYLNCGADDLPSLTSPSPGYSGYEPTLLPLMRLDPAQYVIRSAIWSDSGDGTRRMAQFEISRYVFDYTAVYELIVVTPDKITFDATAKYKGELTREVKVGEEYRAKAIVTYEAPLAATTPTPSPSPSPSPTPEPAPEPESAGIPVLPVVMGGGVIIVAGVLLFLKKRKKGK